MGNISQKDQSSGQREKFREIDRFLMLSERQSNDNTKQIKLWGRVGGVGGTLLFVGIALATGSTKPYFAAAVFAALGIYFGYIMHKKPLTSLLRTERIVETDGIESVYSDFKNSVRIERSDLYIGERYIFKKGDLMVRLSDVRRCYISNDEGEIGMEYFCDIDVSDETGSETLELRKLSSSPEQRQKQFNMINKPIEAAKIRLE